MSDFTHPPYHLTGSASLGASLGVAAAAIAVSIAHAHGFDPGMPINGVFVVTFSTATTSIGNQVGMRIERAAAKRAVRRQAAYICKRVGAIVEPHARSCCNASRKLLQIGMPVFSPTVSCAIDF